MRTRIDSISTLLTMDTDRGDGLLGRVDDACVVLEHGRVIHVGPAGSGPEADVVHDGRGRVVMPALVDMHTHAVWAGTRAVEFARRLAGEDYTAILEAGGGILSTVRATREADEPTLVELCAQRLRRMRARGVWAIEVKSGYGLDPATEARLLRAARAAGERVGMIVRTTFLGAHAVPAEWRPDRAGYVQHVIDDQLPGIVGLADYIDVYVDRGAFTLDEGARILTAGRALGLGLRVHAEQVAHTGAAAMAAELGAISADHLEQLDAAGVAAMAAHGTIAGMLPGAMLYLRDPAPPVSLLREAGVRFAVATDLNPGTSPIDDLWTCATLACVTMRLTVDEALATGDAKFRRRSRKRIDAIREQAGTVFFVSHSLASVRAMCSRAIWLHEGRIKMDGPVDEVADAYAEFIEVQRDGDEGGVS